MTLIWKQVSDDFDDRRFSVCTVFLSTSGQMPSVQLCCDWCLHHALSGFLCWRLQRCWLCYALFQLACMSAASKDYLSIPLDFLLILWFFSFKIMYFSGFNHVVSGLCPMPFRNLLSSLCCIDDLFPQIFQLSSFSSIIFSTCESP